MKSRFFLYFLPSLFRAVLNVFAVVPLTTFYLDPKDFGVSALLGALTGLAVPLASPGAAWSLSAHYFKVSEEERKVLLFNIVAADIFFKVAWGVFFAAIAPWVLPLVIKDYAQNPSYLLYFNLSLVGTLLVSEWPSLSYMLILKKRAAAHALLEVSQLLVAILTTYICLRFLELRTSTLFIAPIVSGLYALVAALWSLRHYLAFRFHKKWLKEISLMGRYSVPFTFLDLFSSSVDRIFVQRWFNLSQLGLYAHSLSYRQALTMANKAFSNTFTPDTLETFAAGKEPVHLRKTLLHWFGLLTLGGLFLVFFVREIVTILTHGKFTAAAPLIPILYLLVYSHSFGITYTQYLLHLKKNAFLLYSGIAVAIVAIILSALLVWTFGIMGAAVALVVSNYITQATRQLYAKRLGCPTIGDGPFCLAVGLLLGTYLLDRTLQWGLLGRSIAFAFTGCYVFLQFKLHEPLQQLLTHSGLFKYRLMASGTDPATPIDADAALRKGL